MLKMILMPVVTLQPLGQAPGTIRVSAEGRPGALTLADRTPFDNDGLDEAHRQVDLSRRCEKIE